jgi:hypothetical protein
MSKKSIIVCVFPVSNSKNEHLLYHQFYMLLQILIIKDFHRIWKYSTYHKILFKMIKNFKWGDTT